MTIDKSGELLNETKPMEMKYVTEQFKRSVARNFSDHCNSGYYALKFNVLKHFVEELKAFGILSEVDASRFEQYNVNIKS